MPSTDTAWGRRIYDQYEIELAADKPRLKYLGSLEPDYPGAASVPESLLKAEPRELGIWDLIFNREIIPKLEGAQKWDPLHEDKMKVSSKTNDYLRMVNLLQPTSSPEGYFKNSSRAVGTT